MPKSNREKLRLSQIREKGLSIDDICVSFKKPSYRLRYKKKYSQVKEYGDLTELTKKKLSDFVKPFLLALGVSDVSIKLIGTYSGADRKNYNPSHKILNSFVIKVYTKREFLFCFSYEAYDGRKDKDIAFHYPPGWFYKTLEDFIDISIKQNKLYFNVNDFIKNNKYKYKYKIERYVKNRDLVKYIFSKISNNTHRINHIDYDINQSLYLSILIEVETKSDTNSNINSFSIYPFVEYVFNDKRDAMPLVEEFMNLYSLPKIDLNELKDLDDNDFLKTFFEIFYILTY